LGACYSLAETSGVRDGSPGTRDAGGRVQNRAVVTLPASLKNRALRIEDKEVLMQEEAKMRLTRRHVSHLAARLSRMPLDKVADPRKGETKWPIRALLTAPMVGMAAGCKGLGEVEELSAWLGSGARQHLGLKSRLPDTTMRDLLVRFDPNEVRKLNYGFIRDARRGCHPALTPLVFADICPFD
jgi:hypothetical protein